MNRWREAFIQQSGATHRGNNRQGRTARENKGAGNVALLERVGGGPEGGRWDGGVRTDALLPLLLLVLLLPGGHSL
jgi:hypothetical protein